MKDQILRLLREDETVVSGEMLSNELGVSRVSIWKHIRKLQDVGYPIESTAKGYRLLRDADALHPWEFAGRSEKIHFFPEISSTMDVALDFARGGADHFTVVIADRQNKGRGRLKRQWFSDTGGLYFTLILRPVISSAYSGRINFAAALDMCRALEELFSLDAVVKWPNDVLVNGKKICGILSQMECEDEAVAFINVGMGLNVNNNPVNEESRATSVSELLGKNVSRKELLCRFLDIFQERFKSAQWDRVMDEWKKRTISLNRKARVVTVKEIVEGKAVDVDESGALILALADGSRKRILYGDCFH